jgi:hypothetical protein
MERSAWTNERLDDLVSRVDQGFARVDRNFSRVDQDIRDLRTEMHTEFRALHGLLHRIGGGIIIALIGVIAAILTQT